MSGGLTSINFNSGKERDKLSRSFSQGCPTLPYRCYPLQKHFRRKVTEINKNISLTYSSTTKHTKVAKRNAMIQNLLQQKSGNVTTRHNVASSEWNGTYLSTFLDVASRR